MATTLVSFLGRAQRRDGSSGYQKISYCFPDGSTRCQQFVGHALMDYLQPDQLLLLGTAGSMWDVLIEELADHAAAESFEEARLALLEAAENQQVSQQQLTQLTPLVAQQLGRPVTLRIIPAGRDPQEACNILQQIAEHIAPDSEAMIDVTHGYRTLPMIGLLAALFLRRTRNIQVRHLFYGELQGEQGRIVALDGLLQMAQWIETLSNFDHNGDVSGFAELLAQDGVSDPALTHLRRASFNERTFNLHDATNNLHQFTHQLPDTLPGISGLFNEQLTQRLSWHKASTLKQQQTQLAWFYLERGDYARACIFGFEAVISGTMDKDANVYAAREQAQRRYEKYIEHEPKEKCERYYELRDLRNYLAHGSIPEQTDKDTKRERQKHQRLLKTIKDESLLKQGLQDCFNTLLGGRA